MTCPFGLDDGAYVLGALSTSERSRFEEHLPTCTSCRDGVAGLAVLPGLLGRLDTSVIDGTEAAPLPPTLLARTLAAASARQQADARRRRRDIIGAIVTAFTLAAVVGVGVHLADDSTKTTGSSVPGVSMVAMRPVAVKAPVSAKVGAYPVDGGTQIVMTCKYASSPPGHWILRLLVYPRAAGDGDQIATWAVNAGQEISIDAMTHLAIADIGRIEIHRADGSAVLVWKAA